MHILYNIRKNIQTVNLRKCIGVNNIESAGSCGYTNRKFMQGEEFEYVAIGILRRHAAVNAQKYHERKQQKYGNCDN